MISFNVKGICLGLYVISMLSCVKDPQDIPPEFTGDPVFRMEGTLDGQVVRIDAGMDDWTAVPISQTQDSAGIYTAVFSKDGCLDQCSPSWTFNFFQALPAYGTEETNFRNTIHQGIIEYVLSDQEQSGYSISVATHPDLFSNGFSYWEDLNNPSDTFGNEYNNHLEYNEELNLCFHANTYLGCQFSQCITYNPATLVPCLAFLQCQMESNSFLSMMVRTEGTAPFRFEWMTGETSQSIVVPVEDSIAAIYAGVQVTDANGNRTTIDQTVFVYNGFVDACYYPITLVSEPLSNSTPEAKAGDLEIVYTDEAGNVWRSTAGKQPEEALAFITDLQYYAESPFGELAYLTSLSVKVLLTNSVTGETKYFEANDLVIPLSHKP